jgi:N-acetylglucosamine repressor
MPLLSKATHQQTRSFNKQLVLRTIFNHSPISRAEIARLTRLTPVSVSEMVAELIAEELVMEVAIEAEEASRRGRKPIMLTVATDGHHLLALRLAVHEMRGAIINLNGEFVYSQTFTITSERGDEAVQRIFDLVDDLLKHASRPLLGIGVASPGIVDTSAGIVRRSVFFGWNDLALGECLQERYQLPVHVANASQVTALAEYLFGSPQESTNLAVVRVGQDVGAGFMLDGELFFGDGFGAGEIGHIVIREDGERCECGNAGCLETIVSSRAVVRRAKSLAGANPASVLAEELARSPADSLDAVLAAYARGDALAEQIARETATEIARALASLVTVLNIQRILFMGSVTQFGEKWLAQIRERLKCYAIPELARQTTIEIAEHGPNAVILGAAALLLSRELGLTLFRRYSSF